MLFDDTIIDPPPPPPGGGRGNYFKIFNGKPHSQLCIPPTNRREDCSTRHCGRVANYGLLQYKRQGSAVRGHFSFRIRTESISNNLVFIACTSTLHSLN